MNNEKKQIKISRIFLHVLGKHPFVTILLILAMTGSIVMNLLPPIALGKIVDKLANKEEIKFITCLTYFLLLALVGFFDAAKEGMITVMGQKMTHALRTEISKKLRRLPADHFISSDPGETESIITNDVDTLEDLFDSGIASMIVDVAKVVSVFIVIFTVSTGLGIMLAVALPLLMIFTRAVQRKMLSAQTENRVAVASANALIPETVHNIRSIHVFNEEKWVENRYEKSINNGFKAVEKNNFFDAVYSPIIITCAALVTGIMMGFSAKGGAFAAFFGMTVGSAVTVINYVGRIFDPLSDIGMEIQNIQSAMAGIKRCRDFLNLPERELPPFSVEFNKDAAPVKIDGISFSYNDENLILNDFSLNVTKGETVTLMGRTGAGKSTIFRLILGLYKPQKGNIYIYGVDADKIPEKDKRRLFGVVTQDFTEITGTIRDEITLRDDGISDEDIWKALETAGLRDIVGSFPEKLDTTYSPSLFSQGQIQLLSIARAIVCNPEILLLDEMTANLDSVTEEVTMNALKKASEDRTVLSISHRLFEKNYGGRIVNI